MCALFTPDKSYTLCTYFRYEHNELGLQHGLSLGVGLGEDLGGSLGVNLGV